MEGFGRDLQLPDSLPVDLHPEILAHVPLHGLARLALTCHAWHRAVEAAVRTVRQWRHCYADAEYGHSEPLHQLFGALFCRCQTPRECIELYTAMQSAAEIVEAEVPQLPLSFVDIAVYDNGPDALAIQLAKCRRAQEWTAEHIAEVFLTFVRYLRAGWFSLDDAESAMLDLRDLVNGFAVTLEEALSVVLRPEFVESRAARAYCIMESYASFSQMRIDGYEFDEEHGTRMATGVAQMRLPLGDVLELIARLDEEEGRAEAQGLLGDDNDRASTVAFLRTWAEATGAPASLTLSEIQPFLGAVSRWDAPLKRHALPLALGWVQALLAPLAAVLPGCPLLQVASGLIEAMQ